MARPSILSRGSTTDIPAPMLEATVDTDKDTTAAYRDAVRSPRRRPCLLPRSFPRRARRAVSAQVSETELPHGVPASGKAAIAEALLVSCEW